ncbi:MAG: 1-deoxy-D-xylulose-5-phosphate reductoisomerase [Fermentimonas sp.]
MRKKKIAILGSTGSIGTQALDVIKSHSDLFEAYVLVANNNVDLLIEQARAFRPEAVVIANKDKSEKLRDALQDLPIKVWSGSEAVGEVVEDSEIDVVLTAMVGFSGLKPTINAIRAGKAIALANKETLVVAGELITSLAIENKVPILPVDSEHSAIFQCLNGEINNNISKIILTASGGPFRGYNREQLETVTCAEALAHPKWNMGAKVSIDSSTMMNKGFEMIEARWLFGVSPKDIEVVVHPQSIIHSMVQFEDNSVIAQMSQPDMRLPIQYALSYPYRYESSVEKIDFSLLSQLTFEKVDTEVFSNLALAYESIDKGGNVPCILNAANEIAVSMFLENKIGFLQMTEIIEHTLSKMPFVSSPSLTDYLSTDKEARLIAKEYAVNIMS